MEKIKFDFKKNWLVFLIVGILAVGFGVVVIPQVTDLGSTILDLVIAILLIAYLALYLFGKVTTSSKGPIKILTIVEFAVISIIALGLILSQFKVITISGAFEILGFVIWFRGITEALRGYYYRGNGKPYTVGLFFLNLLLISGGVYLMLKPPLSQDQLILILAAVLILTGVTFIVLSLINKAPSKKKSKPKKQKETK